MKKITKLFFYIFLGVWFCDTVVAQEYIPLNVRTGFNADVIANGVGPVLQSTTERVDSNLYNLHSLDFKATENAPLPTVGLPIDGLINATNIPGLSFQLQSYDQKNTLRLVQSNTAASLVISNREKASKVYLLATAGDAGLTPVGISAKVLFADGSFFVNSTLTVADWFGGLIRNTAISGIGRVNSISDEIDAAFRNPKLFTVEMEVPEEHWYKEIDQIELSKVTEDTAVLNVFAVSVLKTLDCIMPTFLVVDEIALNRAKLSWRSPFHVPEFGFEYEIRTAGLPGSGAQGLVDSGSLAADTTSKDFTDLSASTQYAIYMRSKCKESLFSDWTTAKKFQTLCQFLPITSNNASLCGLGAATLTATTTSGAIVWYDNANGGEVIHTGDNFNTPVLEESRSYWCSSVLEGSFMGRAAVSEPAPSAAPYTEVGMGVSFDIAEPVLLESVDVYSNTEGTLNVMIVDNTGTEIFSTGDVQIISYDSLRPNVVPLNFDIQAGTGYRMLIKDQSNLELLRQYSVPFPVLDEQGMLTVTSSWYWGNTNSWLYLYFYNVKYIKGCVSPRQEVVVTVNPAPQLTLNKKALFSCGEAESDTLTLVEGRDDFDSYEWFPTTGVSGDAQNGWTFTTTSTQIYTLTAKQTTGQKCTVIHKVLVQPSSEPTVAYSPEADIDAACFNTIIPLEVIASNVENSIQVGNHEPTVFRDNLSAFNNFNASTQLQIQLLFTAKELRDLGLRSGPINALAFYVNSLGSSNSNTDYTVKIAPTNRTKFENRNFIEDNFTTVYFKDVHIHTASGWQEIDFDDAFLWDGMQNLIIELTYQGSNGTSSANTYYTPTTENQLIYFSNNGGIRLSKDRFNIKLKQVDPVHLEWLAIGNSLFVDAAATIPYVPNSHMEKVYYKPQEVGLNKIMAYSTIGGCRVSKAFKINAFVTPQPTLEETQIFCGIKRVTDLEVQGQDIKWYRQAYDGNPLPGGTLLEIGEYYVTQTLDGCESIPKKATVAFLVQPEQPRYTPRVYCSATYLNDLVVEYDTTNELRWYNADGSLITNNSLLRTGVYYLAQSNSVCESERLLVNITINSIPSAPSATPLVLCGRAQASDLSVFALPGAIIKCYLTEADTNELTPSSLLSTQTYYLSQVIGGCESERVAVPITVFAAVPAPQVRNQNFCSTTVRVSDLEVTVLEAATVTWYNAQQGGAALTPNQVLTTGLYYVSQTIDECESERVRFGVNVVDNAVAPEADSQIFCGNPTVSQLQVNLPSGMIAKWYSQEIGGEVLSADDGLENGWYFVSQSIHNCESPRRRVEVSVNEIPQKPTGDALQQFEGSAVINDIVTDQEGVVWFDSLAAAIENRNSLSPEVHLLDNTTYYGIHISEEGCWSEAFAVTVKITLGVHDFDGKQLQYYPNPVTDVLNVTYSDLITRIEVYSINGHFLYGENYAKNEVSIRMDGLPKASYLIRVYTKTGTQIIKVIKN